jgi:nucleoside-diphosphate-sugar epimerase
MKVVVTGGSGRLGRHVLREFLAHGYEVLSLDRVPPLEAVCPSWIADLRRSGDLYEALKGAGAVVHLGAYHDPNLAPASETFNNNVTGTYNVLQAASDLGVERVVTASSIAAYGFSYARRPWSPEYLPLDELHPCRPQDPYGLSKVVGEKIADSFAAQSSMTIVSLRLPGINYDASFHNLSQRWNDPAARLESFWSYIDARDAAVVFRLGVESKLSGHEILNAAAPTSYLREPTAELIRRYIPGVRNIRGPVEGNWSGMNSGKAERVLGFKAEHVWEKYLTGTVLSRSDHGR